MNKKNSLVIVLTFCFLMIYCGLAGAASIVGSKHDFSYTNRANSAYANAKFRYFTSAGVPQGYVTEVCVFCHTPHNASSDNKYKSQTGNSQYLWNRRLPAGDAAGYTPYSSPTMTLVLTAPTGNSLMCMSCHDGITGIAVDNNATPSTTQSLLEPSYGGQYINYTSGAANADKIGTQYNGGMLGWGANIGGLYPGGPAGPIDLSNDHPVSFAWVDGLPGIKPRASINPALRLFGSNYKMECSTCHNVHDPAIPPFLAMDNSSSGMCLSCHDK